MFLSEELQKKWQPVIEHPDLSEIKDSHRRAVTATLLENQENASREASFGSGGYQMPSLLGEAAPTNAMGASSSTASDGAVDIFDPVLISLVRRSMPNLIAYDICGVQPMTGPTGLIFAMRPRFTSQAGSEALYNEANTTFSGSAAANTASIAAIDGGAGTAATGTDPTARATGSGYTVTTGMTTAEALWMGVPTLVIEGDRWVSRVGSSILNSIGLDKFICKNINEYVEKSIHLSSQIEERQMLHRTLRSILLSSPFCNAKMFVKDLEEKLALKWEEYINTSENK